MAQKTKMMILLVFGLYQIENARNVRWNIGFVVSKTILN
jgi:hypothetical protein